MEHMFEILVFENQSLYESKLIGEEGCTKAFVEICKKYISPEYIDESDTELNYGKLFVSLTDRVSDDKPMLVMLIGPTVNQAFMDDIRARLHHVYATLCGNCGAEVAKRGTFRCQKCRV